MTTQNTKAYIRLFEELSFETIEGMEAFVCPNVRFKDPFNDITGIAVFRALLEKTLSDVSDPIFCVTNQVLDDKTLFLRWTFQGHVKGLGNWHVVGMSAVRFDDHGKICEHIDYWDAAEQFYEKLPVIGGVLRMIKRRLQV